MFFETKLISAPIQHLLPVTKLDISSLKISSDAPAEDVKTASVDSPAPVASSSPREKVEPTAADESRD